MKVERKRRRLYEEPDDTQETVKQQEITSEPAISDSQVKQEVEKAEQTNQRDKNTTGKENSEQDSLNINNQLASQLIKRYMVLALAPAVIPFPLLDLAISSGIQIRMLRKLSEIYGIPFSKNRAKSLLVALVSGAHVGLYSGTILKFLPAIGTAGSILSMAMLSPAVTYAVGYVFARHFESGGTLLDFSPNSAKVHFQRAVKQGNIASEDLK
ncbi:MAG: YcjF family protein [Spirochaetota bacterium]